VQRAAKGYGKDVDAKQLATLKAIQKSIEVAMGEGQWDGGVAVYFDVTPSHEVAVSNRSTRAGPTGSGPSILS